MHRDATQHFGAMDQLVDRLRRRPYARGAAPPTPLTDALPGLRQMFNSLACPSWTPRVIDRLREEWNPYSQRVLAPEIGLPKLSVLERDFNLLRFRTESFVEWAHEALHVLVPEPTFCGWMTIASKRDLAEWSLAGEGLAFYYADMVVTPAIRRSVPGAELVYKRSAVSNMLFHPAEVFARLGVDDPDAIVALYVDAFTGKEKAISRGTTDLFPRTFARDVRKFYSGVRLPLEALHEVLVDLDYPGYLARFCANRDLPSLLPRRVLEQVASMPVARYVRELGLRWLPELAALDDAQVQAVCSRRQLQMRAYSAWMLRQVITKGWVRPLQKGSLDEAPIVAALDVYLAALDGALADLARGAALAGIDRRLRAADRVYDRRVYAPLARARAHTMFRYAVHPFFKPTNGVLGLAGEGGPHFSKKAMVEMVELVMKRYTFSPSYKKARDREVIGLLDGFLAKVAHGTPAAVRRAFNAFVTHPAALALWAVDLREVRPSRNAFRELGFAFI